MNFDYTSVHARVFDGVLTTSFRAFNPVQVDEDVHRELVAEHAASHPDVDDTHE